MSTSSKVPPVKPQSVQVTDAGITRPVVAFDGGNRTIQWVDPDGRVHCIPSFIKTIDPTWEDVEADAESVLIEFGGEWFVIGQQAKDLNGVAVFQDDKVAIARQLVLAALQPNFGQSAVRIEKLLMAVPNTRNKAHVDALRAIEGTHEFCRNDEAIIATIRRVVPVDETRGAYLYAMNNGLFLSKRQRNGVLDLGGGTSILRLYSSSGALMREADLILEGTFDLARKIAARITKDIGSSPSLTLIMDGIEREDYQLGTTGFDFRDAFETSRDEWLAGIRAEIKTRWNQWLADMGEVLIIGGSAPLAKPLQEATKGRFKIAPNPQTISILGMSAMEG